MEVRWLETFAAAAREGSMSAAAQELGYARSTVTHHVQSLERALGTKLFDRATPGRPLTRAGVTLLEHAEVVLDRIAVARAEIALLERGLSPRSSRHPSSGHRIDGAVSSTHVRRPDLIRPPVPVGSPSRRAG
ncbi:LysR family transcriptional regulator [Pseudonocardia sp. GCM10023141]|uniref:LysR family transcriptional regulator n=1 Tax=Pseudonocardia sp. GCM10023141 TaxID=3252653 RepID=UPI0036216CD4